MKSGADRNARALAGLRIAVGLLFIIFGQYKVFGTQFTLGGGFQTYIHRYIEHGAYPFMLGTLKDFVMPHATVIAFLVSYSELCIGLALVTGILVRTASVGGLVFMLTMLFCSDYPGPNAPFWQYFGASLSHSVLALCFATFAMADSSQVFALRRRR